MASAVSFGGGALLGVASSLHCVGMCGGIALLLGLPGGAGKGMRPLLDWLGLNGGRALSYMTMGALAGAFGGLALGLVALPQAHLLARWAAAMVLAWLGLSTLGLLPAPAAIGHALLPRFALSRPGGAWAPGVGRLAAGMGWGLMPCGMVYGALLYAAFAGSALGGLLVMAGFALGTMPALLLVHLGSSTLARLARRPALRRITGLAILALALASLLPVETGFRALCRGLGLAL
jgi:sulfite exporter TauE/SafE